MAIDERTRIGDDLIMIIRGDPVVETLSGPGRTAVASRKPIELTEEERRAAERDEILLEAARKFNGPDSPSISELFPNAIPISDLEAAAGCGQVYRVKLALNGGADINELGPFGTPLHGAAENGHLEVVRLLAEHGADVRLLNPVGESARAAASRAGHHTIAEYLRGIEEANAE